MNRSPETIENAAISVRRTLGIENICAPDMYYVLEKLQEKAKKFTFRPALTSEMGYDEAWMDDDAQMLTVRESVLQDARAGRVRARFTLAHEIGHYFLGHKGRRRRNPDKDVYGGAKERIEEGEANQFASYFLVPTELALNAANPEDISCRFRVSSGVAEIAFERIQRVKRKKSGERRRPPDSVIDFLKEAKRRGHPIRSDISEFE